MPLLELVHVSKTYDGDLHPRIGLDDVSFGLEPGELVVAWGMRRSGRSTLVRVAAGVESPDQGLVRFEGESLTGRGGQRLRSRIGYCRKTFVSARAEALLDDLLEDLLACGVPLSVAVKRIHAALERTGARGCARLHAYQLDAAQTVRVAIARALLHAPRLLVIDEPTLGVNLLERDEILAVLRSVADDGAAVLTSTDSATGFQGADRALALDRGRLRGETTPELAEVLPLRRPA